MKEIPQPLGNLFQWVITHTVKYCMFHWNFLHICLGLLPIAPCPTAWHYQEDPGFILLAPSLHILLDIDEFPSQVTLLRLTAPSDFSLCSSHSVIFVILYWTHSKTFMSLLY